MIISCGPSDEEIEIKINQEFDKLIKSYPTPTPVPTPALTPDPSANERSSQVAQGTGDSISAKKKESGRRTELNLSAVLLPLSAVSRGMLWPDTTRTHTHTQTHTHTHINENLAGAEFCVS